jgi:dTDP-glucose pyrophosphorylase
MKVSPDDLVSDVLPRLTGVGAVVDGDRFVGTVTDANVRRRLLVEPDPTLLRCGDVLDDEPVTVGPCTSDEDIIAVLAHHHVRVAAIVDGHRFVGQTVVDAPVPPVSAMVLAGGKGERLHPLTFKVPKPLLQVGRTSPLERVLEGLHASRVEQVWMAVNYMAEMIEDRIGDGTRYGVPVTYIHEEEPLGSAGALSLLEDEPPGPVIVTNSDQITNLSMARIVDYHLAEQADITVASMAFAVDVPYGVFDLRGTELVGLQEKPTVRLPCNAGYYVIDPGVIPQIPKGEYFTMVDLMESVMRGGGRVVVFPMVETWIDIGTPEELEQALLWAATEDV